MRITFKWGISGDKVNVKMETVPRKDDVVDLSSWVGLGFTEEPKFTKIVTSVLYTIDPLGGIQITVFLK